MTLVAITFRILFISFILNLLAHGISATESFQDAVPIGNCESKREQHRYWIHGTKPSMKLKEMMKNYEKFHFHCRSNEQNLNDAIRDKGNLPCKYLIWRAPYVGMGNRLLSLVSTYLLAILTNRVLLTDRVWNWETIFCEPFPKSSMLLNTVVDGHFIQNNAKSFDRFTSQFRTNGSVPFSVIWHITHDSDKVSFCPEELEMLNNVPLLAVYSNMYFVPGFYYTKYKSLVEELFPENDIFMQLGRYFLNPVDEIWRKVKRTYQKEMSQSAVRIGMQIRTFDHPWTPYKSDKLLECSVFYGLLPNRTSGSSSGKKRISCMVASLRPQFYKTLQKTYSDKANIRVFRVGQALEQDSDSKSHNEEAVIELWLLSFSDRLVTSLGSTFGYLASGLAGRSPIFITGMNPYDVGVVDPQVCRLSSSPEPCFHFPPELERCAIVNKNEKWKIQPLLKRCSDFPRGLRISPA